MDEGYDSPEVTELGSVDDLTRTFKAHKTHGVGDFVISNGKDFGSAS